MVNFNCECYNDSDKILDCNQCRKARMKMESELKFQKLWAPEFAINKDKVLEYWIKYRYFNEIKFFTKMDEKTKILDVGSGISTVLHYVSGIKFAIDPLMDFYRKIYTYPEDMKIISLEAEKLCRLFGRESFDIVFCSNVLDHVDSPNRVINHIWQILKTGGHFILTVELFEMLEKRDNAHPHCLTIEDIDAILDDKFSIIFQGTSNWIGLRQYVNGGRAFKNKELILVLKK